MDVISSRDEQTRMPRRANSSEGTPLIVHDRDLRYETTPWMSSLASGVVHALQAGRSKLQDHEYYSLTRRALHGSQQSLRFRQLKQRQSSHRSLHWLSIERKRRDRGLGIPRAVPREVSRLGVCSFANHRTPLFIDFLYSASPKSKPPSSSPDRCLRPQHTRLVLRMPSAQPQPGQRSNGNPAPS